MIEIPPASPYAFGSSVAACGDMLLVGAPYRDYVGRVAYGETLPPPSACLYSRVSGTWQLVGQVTAAAPMQAEGFARSVALASNSFAVGAPGHENGDAPVHAFDLRLQAGPRFDSPDRPSGLRDDLFAEYGIALAVDEQHVVVGATLQGDGGAVYIFSPGGTTTLRGPTPEEGFGASVAIGGDVLVVGANGAYSNEQLAGACYVYRRGANGTWTEHCRVMGKTPGEQFGFAVATDGKRIAVSATGRSTPAGAVQGRVEVHEITQGGCKQVAVFTDAPGFGGSVALSGDRLAIGQPNFGADQTGRVGLVKLPATNISWLLAPSAKKYARLGSSVSLGPDYVAAGMPGLGVKDDSAGRVIVESFA
jgi:hypothetical protein